MKKLSYFLIVLFLTMSTTVAFSAENTVKSSTETLAVPMSGNKIMEEEIVNMNDRLEEIRDIEISELNAKDKKELRKELKEMKKKKKGGAIYIGGSSLLLVILLIILLV